MGPGDMVSGVGAGQEVQDLQFAPERLKQGRLSPSMGDFDSHCRAEKGSARPTPSRPWPWPLRPKGSYPQGSCNGYSFGYPQPVSRT